VKFLTIPCSFFLHKSTFGPAERNMSEAGRKEASMAKESIHFLAARNTTERMRMA